MIRSGKLRHPVVIERFVKTASGVRGQPVGAWQTLYAGVWANIEPLSGRTLEVGRQLVATATHQITIRHHDGTLPEMRVTFGARHFNIGHVSEGDMKRHEMILTCTEQQTGAVG